MPGLGASAIWKEELHPRGHGGQWTFANRAQPLEAAKTQRLTAMTPQQAAQLKTDEKAAAAHLPTREHNGENYLSFDAVDPQIYSVLHDGLEGLTDNNYNALQRYAAAGSQINKNLRSGGASISDYSILDGLIDKTKLSHNVVTYRGIDFGFEETLANLKEGEALVDKGFISASLVAPKERPSIRIYASEGSRGLVVNAHQPNTEADEIIFARNSRLVYQGEDADGTMAFALDQDLKTDTTGLDLAVLDVGGDMWNRETAVRLEREWEQAKPELDKLVGDETGGKIPETPAEPIEPTGWDDLDASTQESIEESFKETQYQQALDNEIENWHENNATEDAADLVTHGFGSDAQWAKDALDLYINGREEQGLPHIPYSIDQLLDAMSISYNAQKDDLEVKFEDIALNEPEDMPPEEQLTFPGVEPPKPHERLTKDMREDLTKVIKDAFESELESKKQDMEPPEYLSEAAHESVDEDWAGMDDEYKFQWASQHTNYIENAGEYPPESDTGPLTMPSRIDPLAEKEGSSDYRNTQRLAHRLASERAFELIKQRGIKGTMDREINTADINGMDRKLWEEWKGASHTDEGKLLQAAIAEELGGRLRMSGKHAVSPDMARNTAEQFNGGYDAVKAYVRGKWETTQWLLQQAHKPEVEVFRAVGIDLPKDITKYKFEVKPTDEGDESSLGKDHPEKWKVVSPDKSKFFFETEKDAMDYAAKANVAVKAKQHEEGPAQPTEDIDGYKRLTDIKVYRNGAASTTTDINVANGWGDSERRVVLRARVPRTAIVSVPAYGQNIHSEHEVVVAGTAWVGWDAWHGQAPEFSRVPLRV